MLKKSCPSTKAGRKYLETFSSFACCSRYGLKTSSSKPTKYYKSINRSEQKLIQENNKKIREVS